MKINWTAALPLMLTGSAFAQSEVTDHAVTGPANKEIRAGWFGSMKPSCTTETPPEAHVLKSAQNGTVKLLQAKVRTNSIPKCPNAELSAVVVFYQSKENYRGTDSFTLEIKSVNGKISLHKFTVLVAGLVQ
jgi:hypothetical protein